jgi:DNA-directed RNA polymerase specialized sigma24 family protein
MMNERNCQNQVREARRRRDDAIRELYLDGLSQREIAKIVGCSVGWVNTVINEGKGMSRAS